MNKVQLGKRVIKIIDDLDIRLHSIELKGEEWDDLSSEIANIASEIHIAANRVASYSGVAKRQHNREAARPTL